MSDSIQTDSGKVYAGLKTKPTTKILKKNHKMF